MKRLIKVGALRLMAATSIAANMTACSGVTSFAMYDDDKLTIHGGPEVVSRLMDGQIGMVNSGKRVEDVPQDTPYHELRRAQEMTRRYRLVKPSKGGK